MAGDDAHDIAVELVRRAGPAGHPVRRALVAPERAGDARVAERPVLLQARGGVAEPRAVRAALDADLVPQVVEAQHARGDGPRAHGAAVEGGRRRALRHEAHVGGDGEEQVPGPRVWDREPPRRGCVRRGLKAERAGLLPEALAVLARAREAHVHVVRAEHLARDALEARGQLCLALVPVGEQVLKEQVVLHAAHGVRRDGHLGVQPRELRHRAGVAAVHEVLRQQDAALRQDGEHAVRVREARARPYLRRDGSERGHVLGEGALCHHELGVRKREVVVVTVRLCEEVQVAQVRLDERVELARRVVRRVELAKQVREHADVREVSKVERVEVEVQVRVVDPVRGQVVVQAGERGVHPLQRRVRGREADVGRGEARQRGQGLRAVRCLLLAAQRLDLAGHGRKVPWRHGALAGKELVLLGRARAFVGRHQLHLAAVGRVAHELAQQALEVAVAQAGAHVGHLIFVEQVVHGAGVVVQPAGHRLHGQRHAVRVRAPVALA